MSAETLRRAATAIRVDNLPHPGNGDEGAAWLTVADWLDDLANRIVLSRNLRHEDDETHALAVARAYLGDPS